MTDSNVDNINNDLNDLNDLNDDDFNIDDVDAAIELLRRDFRVSAAMPLRVVLRNQLYALVKNRTRVDLRLALLLKRRRVRSFLLFKGGAGSDDIAVLDATEYVTALKNLIQSAIEARRNATVTERDRRFDDGSQKKRARTEAVAVDDALRLFADNVLTATPADVRISHVALRRALRVGDANLSDVDCDACVQRLVECGALLAADATNYHWCVPNGGVFLAAVANGRKEALRGVARKPGSHAESDLVERGPLKSSALGWHFHLQDLLGSDNVTATTFGNRTLYSVDVDA
jgi:hypothetical protein